MTETAPGPEQDRLKLAVSTGQFLSKASPTATERVIFENLARALVTDADALVRAALAAEIRSCAAIPVVVAEKIAQDIEEIAIPFIALSPVLSEEFLADLVVDCSEAARSAVAGRSQISEPLCRSLARNSGKSTIARLLENKGAVCSGRVYLIALERFEDSPAVHNGLLSRDDLTLMIIDRLVERISAAASEALVKKYGLAADLAGYLQDQARRVALHRAMRQASEAQIDAYLRHQYSKGNISPDLLAQFLEGGLPELFRKALALSAGEEMETVETFLGGGPSGLGLILDRTDLDRDSFPMIVASFVEYYET